MRSFVLGQASGGDEVITLDWPSLNCWTKAHNLAGVFHNVLKDAAIHENIKGQWQDFERSVLLHNLRALRSSVTLFTIFDSAKISAVAMRGLSLSHGVYPSAGIRYMRDVDILIAPDNRAQLLEAMESAGIGLHQKLRSQYVYLIDGIPFEFHWSLLTAKRYRDTIDSGELLNSRLSRDTPDGRIFCLSDDHEFIGLVAHAFVHHELTIMKQLVDIALFALNRPIDWDRIHHWCTKAHVTNMFGLTLGLVERLFLLEGKLDTGPFRKYAYGRGQKDFTAYIDPFFGRTGLFQYLRLKRNLIFVAEDPLTKIRQLLRLFTLTEARDIYNRYFNQP